MNATDDLRKNFPTLKQDLLNTGLIEAVARSSSDMTWINNDFTQFHWTGQDPRQDVSIDVIMTEWDYDKAARLQFVAGRPFSREYKTDSSASASVGAASPRSSSRATFGSSVVLNEAAVRLIGYKDPVGKTMRLGDQPLTIIGVTKNVVARNPFKPVGPCAILFNPNNVNAIFISCLGLFGLAMFMAERRSKEVSIRKVLGASVANLWLLLSKEFIWLVGIAIAIASPLAVALITVSSQAIKAASANPAKTLKTE